MNKHKYKNVIFLKYITVAILFFKSMKERQLSIIRYSQKGDNYKNKIKAKKLYQKLNKIFKTMTLKRATP